MKSIDNMREYVLTAASVNATTRAVLAGYIDGIEREVADNERFRREAEPFTNRLRDAVEERADVTLFGVDYTALPLDTDGEAIHVGNWIDVGDGKQRVEAVTPDTVYWWEEDGCHWVNARMVTRHHVPTVEDMLAEFGIDWEHESDCEDRAALLKEYAARLTLRGDE